MGRFLRKVEDVGLNTTPSLVRNNSNTREIEMAATSGNKMMDVAIDHAVKLADKLIENKRLIELSGIKIDSNKAIGDYEAQWVGRDKYSNENYDNYMGGLNDVMENNRNLINGTVWTNKTDVEKWDLESDDAINKARYTNAGQWKIADNKRLVGEIDIQIEGQMADYESNQDTALANASRKSAMELYSSLKNLGVPEHEIEKMKIDRLIKSDLKRIEAQSETIVNDTNTNNEEKRALLQDIKAGIDSKGTYDGEANTLLSEGVFSNKEVATSYANQLENKMQDFANKSNGLIQRFGEAIQNQEYQERQRVESTRANLQTKYDNNLQEIDSNMRMNNDVLAVSKAEGVNVTYDDIINDAVLTKKYWGGTLADIVNTKSTVELFGADTIVTSKGEYIQFLSSTEISKTNAEIKINQDAGVPRSEAIGNVMTSINSIEDTDARTNAMRAYVGAGVLSPEDYKLSTLGTYDAKKLLDTTALGKTTTQGAKINYGTLPGNNNRTKNLMLGLNSKGVQIVNNSIVGAVMLGELPLGKQEKLDASTIARKYQSDRAWTDFINKNVALCQISKFRSGDALDKFSARKANKESVLSNFNRQFDSKDILLNQSKNIKEITVDRERSSTQWE